MASFHSMVWWQYILWNIAGFAGAVVVNSFVEWAAHRFVLHSRVIVRFAYELHDRQHHVIFDGRWNYHAHDDFMRSHVRFVARDYFLFLGVTVPLWVGAELLVRRPVLAGCLLATLAGLQAFNSLHWRFHVPSDSWFQGTRFFRFLKEHHRLHHADPRSNFNVHFLPIADLCLGTLRRSG